MKYEPCKKPNTNDKRICVHRIKQTVSPVTPRFTAYPIQKKSKTKRKKMETN